MANGDAGSLRNQYYATFVLNLVTFVNGVGYGWLSPMMPKLQSEDTPISIGIINDNQASWVVTNTSIGFLAGVALFAVLVDKIGRKNSMCLPAIIQLIAWLLKIFPQNIFYLYISRFLVGLAGGAVFTSLPIYVSEYSDVSVRGMLTASMMIVYNLGFLLAFVMGSYADYYYIAYISVVICGIYLLLRMSLPESPSFLLQQNKHDEAEQAYCYFKGIQSRDDIISTEKFLKSKPDHQEKFEAKDTEISWKDFATKSSVRAILIAFVTCMLMQLCGVIALMSYTERTFREAGSNLSAEVSSIIVSIAQLLGAYVSTTLVDRVGRKILLSLSSLTTGLFLAVLGVFIFCKSVNFDVSQFNWIPVFCYSGAIFCASWGIYPIPFVMITEMLPIKLRAIVMSSGTWCMGITGVFLMKFYLDLVNGIGLHSCLLIFASFCIFEAVFVLILVPETKGKTIDNILRILGGEK